MRQMCRTVHWLCTAPCNILMSAPERLQQVMYVCDKGLPTRKGVYRNWLRECCPCDAEQAGKTCWDDRKPTRRALLVGVCVSASDTGRSSLGKLTAIVYCCLLRVVSVPPLH